MCQLVEVLVPTAPIAAISWVRECIVGSGGATDNYYSGIVRVVSLAQLTAASAR